MRGRIEYLYWICLINYVIHLHIQFKFLTSTSMNGKHIARIQRSGVDYWIPIFSNPHKEFQQSRESEEP